MKNRVLYLLLFTLALPLTRWSSAYADEVIFRAQAPGQVIVGRPFQLTYTVNQRAKDLRAPEFTGFDYIAGPYTSQSSSTSFVNGKRSSTFTLTYTYTLMGQAPGTFTLTPATITVAGQQYTSNGLKITILPEDEPQKTTTSSNPNKQTNPTAQTAVDDGTQQGNIFMRTMVSKTKVYEQEAILLSYKVYVAGVDLKQFTNNTTLPDFTSFLQQKIDLNDVQFELEHYNGRNYQTATIFSTLLYPQKSGDIVIDPASFEAVLLVPNQARSRSIFDDFFGSYTTATRVLKAPGVTIHVTPLPAGKPAGFSGAVGQFTLESTISSTDLQTNDPVTLKVNIKGSGNMKLIKTPAVDWPEGFEAYDPKVTNNFKTTASGMSGNKQIEYLAIPRAAGEYTIPAIEFAYFDTQEEAYKTVRSPEYTLHIKRNANDTTSVAAGQPVGPSYVNKQDIQELGSDIRYIATGDLTLPASDLHRIKLQFGSWQMWLCYILPLLIAVILFFVCRRYIESAEERARRMAKRAKTDDELQLYLSERLQMPASELRKDNIATALRTQHVPDELIQRTLQLLDESDFRKYAPEAAGDAQDFHKRVDKLISELRRA